MHEFLQISCVKPCFHANVGKDRSWILGKMNGKEFLEKWYGKTMFSNTQIIRVGITIFRPTWFILRADRNTHEFSQTSFPDRYKTMVKKVTVFLMMLKRMVCWLLGKQNNYIFYHNSSHYIYSSFQGIFIQSSGARQLATNNSATSTTTEM